MCRVAHVHRAHRRAGLTVDARNRRHRGRVRLAVVRHRVWRHAYHRCRLVDGVGDGRSGDIAVVGRTCKCPGVGRVGGGIGMCRVAHVHRAHRRAGLTVDARNRRHRGRVRLAVVRHRVRRHAYHRRRLVDGVGDGRSRDIVVVGRARKCPGVGRVGAGIGVRRVAHVHRAHGRACLTVDASDRRHRGRVRLAVVRHRVRRHAYHRRRLVDGVGDGRSRDIVVVGRARKCPGVGRVGAGIGVRRVAHVHRAHGRACLTVDASDRRHRGRVRLAVVRHRVRRYAYRRRRLVHRQRRRRVRGSRVQVAVARVGIADGVGRSRIGNRRRREAHRKGAVCTDRRRLRCAVDGDGDRLTGGRVHAARRDGAGERNRAGPVGDRLRDGQATERRRPLDPGSVEGDGLNSVGRTHCIQCRVSQRHAAANAGCDRRQEVDGNGAGCARRQGRNRAACPHLGAGRAALPAEVCAHAGVQTAAGYREGQGTVSVVGYGCNEWVVRVVVGCACGRCSRESIGGGRGQGQLIHCGGSEVCDEDIAARV